MRNPLPAQDQYLPAATEGRDCSAARAAISSTTIDFDKKSRIVLRQNGIDQCPGDSGRLDLRPPSPFSLRLPCHRSRIQVEKAIRHRTLCIRPQDIGYLTSRPRSDSNWHVKHQLRVRAATRLEQIRLPSLHRESHSGRSMPHHDSDHKLAILDICGSFLHDD